MNVKLIGNEKIFEPSTKAPYSIEEMRFLNGIVKEAVIEVKDKDDISDAVMEFINNNPEWERLEISLNVY